MMKNTIDLFMWGYQAHFRGALKITAHEALKYIGIQTEPKVLLVGMRLSGSNNRNPVCIEPEYDEWPLSIFTDALENIDHEIKNHPSQNLFFDDESSMRDKPENIRRDSVRQVVENCLAKDDVKKNVRSFCGSVGQPIGDYYVVPIIQLPESVFEKYPPLSEEKPERERYTYNGYASFIYAVIFNVLSDAFDELQRREPGRRFQNRNASETARRAASAFMRTPAIAINSLYGFSDLFERFNFISSLMHEGVEGKGQLVLVNKESESFEYILQFKEPVPFGDPRWVRKILEMASDDVSLISDTEYIYGLGKVAENYDVSKQEIFVVKFLDHYYWEVCHGDQILLRSKYGEPQLPQVPIDNELFFINYRRIFPGASAHDCELAWSLLNTAIGLDHGSMIVISGDAETESSRLSNLGTRVEPVLMSDDLLKRVSGIDGTILMDYQGTCYGIGVVLDGMATYGCTPSRGSRYNAAVRYIKADNNVRRLAIVVSDDNTVDVIPTLRPMASRNEIESRISALESASTDNYHPSQKWLDKHRFYFSDTQCQRINAALARIRNLPHEYQVIRYIVNGFVTNPDMDDSYLIP